MKYSSSHERSKAIRFNYDDMSLDKFLKKMSISKTIVRGIVKRYKILDIVKDLCKFNRPRFLDMRDNCLVETPQYSRK